jgi:hypothetical protein
MTNGDIVKLAILVQLLDIVKLVLLYYFGLIIFEDWSKSSKK